MEITDYLLLIGKQIQAAADRCDKAEALRLFIVLRDVANDKIRELEA